MELEEPGDGVEAGVVGFAVDEDPEDALSLDVDEVDAEVDEPESEEDDEDESDDVAAVDVVDFEPRLSFL